MKFRKRCFSLCLIGLNQNFLTQGAILYYFLPRASQTLATPLDSSGSIRGDLTLLSVKSPLIDPELPYIMNTLALLK